MHYLCTIRLVSLCALLVALFVIHVPARQTAAKWRLSKVDFVTLDKQTYADSLAACGLKIGQEVDVDTLNTATRKLLNTGVFKRVGYKYRFMGSQLFLTFEVEEATLVSIPCVFDNFIWFSDAEIQETIRRTMPAFDGMAPESDLAVNKITTALKQMLADKKISGEVSYMPSNNPSGTKPEHYFSVKGVTLKVCAIQFSGASPGITKELTRESEQLLGTEYSRQEALLYAHAALLPVYKNNGYLKARFLPVSGQLGADGACRDGVTLTLPIQEGLQYTWEKAVWSGNAILGAQDLDKALDMSAGDIANFRKIDVGLFHVGELYDEKGYMTARLMPRPDYDEARRRVTWQVTINEGPQYKMGTLSFSGFPDKEVEKLHGKWKLAPGAPYSTRFLRDYIQANSRDIVAAAGNPNIGTSVKPDDATQTVNITITTGKN
ncbi:MAG: hypothetical protein ACKV2V_24050 [Blastocatellia bacterium]